MEATHTLTLTDSELWAIRSALAKAANGFDEDPAAIAAFGTLYLTLPEAAERRSYERVARTHA